MGSVHIQLPCHPSKQKFIGVHHMGSVRILTFFNQRSEFFFLFVWCIVFKGLKKHVFKISAANCFSFS